MNHKKLLGVLLFLGLIYAALLGSMFMLEMDQGQITQGHRIAGQRIGLFGILTLAAGIVIITGNIDLSMGSQVALGATVFCTLVMDLHLPLGLSVLLTVLLGTMLGGIIGLIVTLLRVQSFIVTLCGMFIFRGLARLITGDKKTGLESEFASLKAFFHGNETGMPTFLLIMLTILALGTIFLHFTVFGRYFFALGSNERAAHFAGVPTKRVKTAAFMLSSTLVGFYAFLFVMENNSVNPNDTGNMLELYAIAGAVLGGCSLRGGDGTSLGLLIGTCIITFLPTATDYWLEILLPTELRKSVSIDAIVPVVIGLALLFGAIMDEILRRGRQATKG